MKRDIPVSALLNMAILFTLFIAAGPLYSYDSVVSGRNNAEYDVKAVQEAINKGGTVLLTGTFDFGQKGRVNITNDVEVAGESGGDGRPSTKVIGGFWSFHSPLPTTELPLPGPGPRIKISNIHFDGATWTPIHFAYTSGAEISNNVITNVRPYAISYKWKGGDQLLMHAGGIMGSRYVHRDKMLPGAVSGHLKFNHNRIDLRAANPEITMGQGAFILWTWGATIEIRGNTIRNVSRNSIECLDNYLDEEGRGSLVITENNIVTPKVGIPFPSPSTPNGMVLGWFFDKTGGSDPARNSKITIIRNYVQANGKTSIGIASLSDGSVIVGNRVELTGGEGARGISAISSNSFVARNQIDGSGMWAMMTTPYKGIQATGNTFAWNDISRFDGLAGDFYCAGNKHTFIGEKCKVVDKGSNNNLFFGF